MSVNILTSRITEVESNDFEITRMTAFINAKIQKSGGQTKWNDIYRGAAYKMFKNIILEQKIDILVMIIEFLRFLKGKLLN